MCSNRSRETCCQSGSRMNCIPSRRASFAAGTKSASPATRTTTSAWRFNVMAAISKPIRMSTPFWRRAAAKSPSETSLNVISPRRRRRWGPRLQNPGSVTVPAHFTETQGEVRTSAQRLEELVTEDRLLRLAVVDRRACLSTAVCPFWSYGRADRSRSCGTTAKRDSAPAGLRSTAEGDCADKLSNRCDLGNRLRVR